MPRPPAERVCRWVLFCLVGGEAIAVVALALASGLGGLGARDGLEAERALVSALGLTDLALWSEATYCRHPSLADPFAAHSVHPSAPDLFPAGSIVSPPEANSATDAGRPGDGLGGS